MSDDAAAHVSGPWRFDGVEEGYTGVDDDPSSDGPQATTDKVPRKPKDRGAPSRAGLAEEQAPEAPPERPKRSLRQRLTGG